MRPVPDYSHSFYLFVVRLILSLVPSQKLEWPFLIFSQDSLSDIIHTHQQKSLLTQLMS